MLKLSAKQIEVVGDHYQSKMALSPSDLDTSQGLRKMAVLRYNLSISENPLRWAENSSSSMYIWEYLTLAAENLKTSKSFVMTINTIFLNLSEFLRVPLHPSMNLNSSWNSDIQIRDLHHKLRIITSSTLLCHAVGRVATINCCALIFEIEVL